MAVTIIFSTGGQQALLESYVKQYLKEEGLSAREA